MQLAEKCNISTNYLSEIETGKKFPSVEMIEILAKNLSIQPYMLFLNTNEITINTEIACQKRNKEFSERLIQNMTTLLKEFNFME